MILENILLCEVTYTQKDKSHVLSNLLFLVPIFTCEFIKCSDYIHKETIKGEEEMGIVLFKMKNKLYYVTLG